MKCPVCGALAVARRLIDGRERCLRCGMIRYPPLTGHALDEMIVPQTIEALQSFWDKPARFIEMPEYDSGDPA